MLAVGTALAFLPACSDHDGHNHGVGEGHAHVKDGVCTEHDVPEDKCGICNPEKAAALAPSESLLLRLPDKESAQIVGVEIGRPVRETVTEGINVYAEISFDQNRLAQISAPAEGIVQEVKVDLGTRVEEGAIVTHLWSAKVSEMLARAVLTHQNLEREMKLRATNVITESDIQRTKAEHRAICQQLYTLGFTEEDIDTFADHPEKQPLVAVRAPFAGEIIRRLAVRGSLVEMGKELFTIADTSIMWAMLAIPESDLANVRLEQMVELRIEGLADRVFTGKLTWIAAQVDEKTRLVSARAEVPNPDRILKASMFARARIVTAEKENVLTVPETAVQQIDGKPFLFVQTEDDLFEVRAVRLGGKENGRLAVLEGLAEADRLAFDRTFPLKSAFLISRLGAGCADD